MPDTGFIKRLAQDIAEHFSSTWRLLSETSLFLSRTKEFYRYENSLRNWRHRLESCRNDDAKVQEIRSEIVALRKSLRKRGYDLTLGKKEICIEGFRSDTALGEGFRRVVLLISEHTVYYLAGQENHVQLMQYIEHRLNIMGVQNIRQKHYLWYRWRNNVLVFSGADTESREDFEQFKDYVAEHELFLLKQLKKL